MIFGSPISSSTPGGMEIGVRPSFDDLLIDVENGRRAEKAGTRKPGSVVTNGEDAVAFSKALPLHEANMVAGLYCQSP